MNWNKNWNKQASKSYSKFKRIPSGSDWSDIEKVSENNTLKHNEDNRAMDYFKQRKHFPDSELFHIVNPVPTSVNLSKPMDILRKSQLQDSTRLSTRCLETRRDRFSLMKLVGPQNQVHLCWFNHNKSIFLIDNFVHIF